MHAAVEVGRAATSTGTSKEAGESTEPFGDRSLAALGRTYVRFALDEPALFALMFRPGELRSGDPVPAHY